MNAQQLTGLALRRDEIGHWLDFTTKDGRTATVHLESLTMRFAPTVTDRIVQWAQEQISAPARPDPVRQVCEWIKTELVAGMITNPLGGRHMAWNDAHRRVDKIVESYKRGEGLFQLTQGKEGQ